MAANNCNTTNTNAGCTTCEGCPEVISSDCVRYDGTGISCLSYPVGANLSTLLYTMGNQICNLNIQIQNLSDPCVQVYEDYFNLSAVSPTTSLPLTYTPDLVNHVLLFYRNGILQLLDENDWSYDSGSNTIEYPDGFINTEDASVVYWACSQTLTDGNSIQHDMSD